MKPYQDAVLVHLEHTEMGITDVSTAQQASMIYVSVLKTFDDKIYQTGSQPKRMQSVQVARRKVNKAFTASV